MSSVAFLGPQIVPKSVVAGALPRQPTGFEGLGEPTSKALLLRGWEAKRGEGRGAKMIYASDARKAETLAPPLLETAISLSLPLPLGAPLSTTVTKASTRDMRLCDCT